MNEAWDWRPLGELFEIGAGKTMSAAARNGADKTPFLRTSNVLWDEIDLSSVDEMSISGDELPSKLLRKGDLLVCEGGEIGRAAIWNGEVDTMSFQNHLHRLRPVDKRIEPRFYVFFLQAAFTLLGIYEGAGNKTTIPNLSRGRLAALQVPRPAFKEQHAIMAVLAKLRDGIKVQDQSIVATQELKRAAMQNPFCSGAAGRGAEGDGDRAGSGELGSKQPRLSSRPTAIWYIGEVYVQFFQVSCCSYPQHRTAENQFARLEILRTF